MYARVAIIADIHGNAVALDTVLAQIAREEAGGLVCLGDVAATGPQPVEVIQRLRDLACPVVMGNADAWLLQPERPETADEMAGRIADIDFWCLGRLSAADLDYIKTFRDSIEIELGAGISILCFHGSPKSFNDRIHSTTSDEDLESMLDGARAPVLAGGHTHIQLLRRVGSSMLINPGSVGLPFERVPETGQVLNPPWAEYALVEWEEGNLQIALRRVAVDVEAIVQAAHESGMPHAGWWAEDWMRNRE